MTQEQRRLALADTAFVALWLLMNFFWMWELYAVSIPLAVPGAIASAALIAFTERNAVAMNIAGSNIAWFLKDFFWMMENSGGMPSGVRWGTLFFALTLGCAVAALVIGAGQDALAETMERIKRIRLLFASRK